MGRDAGRDITNHIIMAKTKTEQKHHTQGPKSPKKKNSVRYPFYFVEKNYNKKSLEGKFQNNIQTTISGIKSTIKTNTGKIINRNIFSEPLSGPRIKKQPARSILKTGTVYADCTGSMAVGMKSFRTPRTVN